MENPIIQNIIAFIITFGIALFWLRVNDFFAHKGWISSDLSRKIIHMGTGPIFVVCWLLFNDEIIARFLAALIPLAISLQFFLVGSGLLKDDSAVKAMSRSGDRREILRGPLYYGIIFVLVTLLFWRNSPTGIIALMLMCGGDGLADIIGRRFGKKKLPWNNHKTWIGSISMLFGGWVMTVVIMGIFIAANIFSGTILDYLLPITIIAFAGAIVESLSLKDIDNITISVTAIIIGMLFF